MVHRFTAGRYQRQPTGVVRFGLELKRRAFTGDCAAFSGRELIGRSRSTFRGRYDVRLKFGYAFERESVSIAVPKNVKIAPGKPPVFATR